MLAGCSSCTLISPRHRLRSEAPIQFQACHFQLPSMNTQRLDFPCSFPRKDSSRSQPIRPAGLSIERPIESKTSSCSLKQSIRLPSLATTASSAACHTEFGEGRKDINEAFWEKGKSLKRFAEQSNLEEYCTNRTKRKKGCSVKGEDDIFEVGEDHGLSSGQLGSGHFWFHPGFDTSRSVQNFTGLNPPQLPFSWTCSGDEEKVCFVPGEIISQPLSFSKTHWVEEKDGETSHGPTKEASASSASSESQSSGPWLNEVVSEHEVGNGSRNPCTHGVAEAEEEEDEAEHQGFELVRLLTACVEAIGSKNIPAVNHFIAKLGELSSPNGTTISRLISYYTEALALRVARMWPNIFHITPPREFDRVEEDYGFALRLLNQVSPIPKFLHFTCNELLIRAFEGKERVHIIDFDIKQGLQWPSFFQSLASRTNPPSHVRITGIGESKQELNETGDRLSGFAEALNLPFEFHPVVDRLEDVRLWMLHVKQHESVAVNCIFQLHRTLYDGNGGVLRDFLGLIKSTNPTVVVIAEQEGDHNEPKLEARVSNSMKYYSAIFDSVDYSLPLDSPIRMKIEEMFAKEIRNIVGCEGVERLERHEGFEKWRKLMEQGGFQCMKISERELLQSQLLLKMYTFDEFNVKKQGQDGDALSLGWFNQPLYTVSAWSPQPPPPPPPVDG